MKTRTTVRPALLLLLIAGISLCLRAGAVGQVDPALHSHFDKVDIRTALLALCARAHMEFSITPDVHGAVTMDIGKTTFDSELRAMLKQVDASYRLQGNVLAVYVKDNSPAVQSTSDFSARLVIGGNPGPGTPVMSQDKRYVFVLQGNTLFQFQKSDMSLIRTTTGLGDAGYVQTNKNIAHLAFDRVEIKNALNQAFAGQNRHYSMDSRVRGIVTLDLHNVTLDGAVRCIVKQVGATYRINAGVYEIMPQGANPELFAPPIQFPKHERDPAKATRAMIQDDEFLYVLRDITVFKIRKTNLEVVQFGSLYQTVDPI